MNVIKILVKKIGIVYKKNSSNLAVYGEWLNLAIVSAWQLIL
jgi:hypothetical protein